MKTTREVKGVGLSDSARRTAPEKVTGHVQYVADLKPHGHAARQAAAEPARPRPDHPHRRQQGQGAARRARGAHRRRHPGAQEEGARRAPTRCSPSIAWSSSGQPVAAVAADELADRRGGARPDRGRVRGAARRRSTRSSRCSPARRRWRTRAPRPTPARRSPTPAWPSAKSEAAPPKAVNIAQQARLQRGDVAKGFAEADLVLEKTYRVPMVHQGYLEPHAVLAEWDRNGLLTLWASTQGSFNTRSEVADVLGHPGEPASRSSRWSAAAASAARSARSASRSPRCWPQATEPAGALRHDPARGAGGGHARAPGHHQAEDRRQARRHPDGARGRDDHRVRRVLGRGADDERGVPRQRLPVADASTSAASRC